MSDQGIAVCVLGILLVLSLVAHLLRSVDFFEYTAKGLRVTELPSEHFDKTVGNNRIAQKDMLHKIRETLLSNGVAVDSTDFFINNMGHLKIYPPEVMPNCCTWDINELNLYIHNNINKKETEHVDTD